MIFIRDSHLWKSLANRLTCELNFLFAISHTLSYFLHDISCFEHRIWLPGGRPAQVSDEEGVHFCHFLIANTLSSWLKRRCYILSTMCQVLLELDGRSCLTWQEINSQRESRLLELIWIFTSLNWSFVQQSFCIPNCSTVTPVGRWKTLGSRLRCRASELEETWFLWKLTTLTPTQGTAIMTSFSPIVLARSNWHNSAIH